MNVSCQEYSEEQYEALKHAAALEGVEINDFIKLAAVREAHNVIDRYNITHVTLEQGKKMMKALDSSNYDYDLMGNKIYREGL